MKFEKFSDHRASEVFERYIGMTLKFLQFYFVKLKNDKEFIVYIVKCRNGALEIKLSSPHIGQSSIPCSSIRAIRKLTVDEFHADPWIARCVSSDCLQFKLA